MVRCFSRLFPVAFLSMLIAPFGLAAEPVVVVTIKPFHSLTSAVMKGAGTPHLLLQGNSSPHGYALRPSDIATLNKADLIIWTGPMLESFLIKPLASLSGKDQVLTVEDLDAIKTLPTRALSQEDEHEGHEEEAGEDDHHHHGDVDPHLWLDINNAKVFVAAVRDMLSTHDPQNATLYKENSAQTLARLDALNQHLEETLKDVKNRPYLSFHDAYQYFEKAYGLQSVGSITLNPEQSPSAQHILEIRKLLRDKKVACVFQEPQFPTKMAQTVLEGTEAKLDVLDPLGAELADGPDLYFTMMSSLGYTLHRCLAQ